jgi:hypothetical protein
MDLGRNTRDDFDRRLEARRQLSELAPRRFDELKVIAEDVREDLDIRRAAIRWLAVGNPRRARGILRKLRKDENAIIGETVRTVEQDIPEYIENQRREGGV